MGKEAIKILLVEDEEAHAEAVRRAFDQESGRVHLTWASTIKEALACLEKSIPHLVVTDWLLPDGKGTDILPSDEKNRLFPVVLMTSHGNEQLAVDAMKAGVLDYVVKSPTMFADMPHIADRALWEWATLTQRKQSEEKLRESEERFRTIFEQGPLGMHIAGLDYRFVAVNAAFCHLVGYSEEELNKLTFLDITYPEDLKMDLTQARQLLKGEMPYYKMEKRHVTKAGEIVWIDCTRSIVRGADGGSLYFLTMLEDITERKHAEELLKLRAEELRRSNADLEHFAYIASHDLQEPLRNVATCLQMIEKRHKHALGAETDQLISLAVNSATKMRNLILDLLTYSRISTRGVPFEEVDSEIILGEAVRNLKHAIREKGAIVTHNGLPKVRADGTQLLQAFQNFISNAIKFSKENPPKVHISAIKGEKEWIFSVGDNGIGIESQYFDRIFEIFQQLDKKGNAGTGIGLAIIKRIIERHRGRLWVESEIGVGSTFYFTIPDRDKSDK